MVLCWHWLLLEVVACIGWCPAAASLCAGPRCGRVLAGGAWWLDQLVLRGKGASWELECDRVPMHAPIYIYMRAYACSGLQDCEERRGLASFEVPFAYQEAGAFIIGRL